MTKKQLSVAVGKWHLSISKMALKKKNILSKLQEMNRLYGDGKDYNILTQLLEHIEPSYYRNQALHLYAEYYRIVGQQKALIDFLIATENFGNDFKDEKNI